MPVVVYALAEVHSKNGFEHIGRCVAAFAHRSQLQFAALVVRARLCFGRRTQQTSVTREMKTQRHSDAEDLKRSLIA
jgi:hypothetical protein